MSAPADRRGGGPGTAVWPAERLYWAVLEAPGWGGRQDRGGDAAPLPEGLMAQAQEALPAPVESLHLVALPAGPGAALVCGADRTELAELDPSTERLVPDRVPPVGAGGVDPARLNLRCGPFAAPAARARRRRARAIAAGAALLASALLSAGLWRRAGAWDRAAADARARAADRLAAEAPGLTADGLALRLPALRAAAGAAAAAPRDAALDLAAVLRAWPSGVPTRPPSISASASGVSIAVTVEGPAGPFLAGLRPPPGFAAGEPRLSAADGLTRVSLRLTPTPAPTPAPAVPAPGRGTGP